MTSATFEKEFESLNDTQQKAVGYFIRFLLSQDGTFAKDRAPFGMVPRSARLPTGGGGMRSAFLFGSSTFSCKVGLVLDSVEQRTED